VSDLFVWLRDKRIQVVKELVVHEESNARADLWVRDNDGRVHWCDLEVSDPSQPSYLQRGSARKPGVAAKTAESNKVSEWKKRLPENGVDFRPLAMESTGRMGTQFIYFINRMLGQTNDGPGRYALTNQLSVTMMKSNVVMVREAGSKLLAAADGH